MWPGPSGFDLSDSAPPPAPLEGSGPPPQKIKFSVRYATLYTPAHYTTVTRCLARRRRKFCGATLKNHILLSFLSARAYVRTSQNINCWDLVLNPTHKNLRGRVLRAGPPPPLAFSVFCFPLPLTNPGPLGPCTVREIKNARPGGGLASGEKQKEPPLERA